MTKALLAHPGTQHAPQLAKQLAKKSMLYKFWTGFAIAEKSFLNFLLRLSSYSIQRRLSNRVVTSLKGCQLKTSPFLEWKYLKKLQKGLSPEKVFFERNLAFQQSIPISTLRKADIIIGFDTSSWILAERCKEIDKCFILDISIAHPLSKRKVYQHIVNTFPDWTFSIDQKSDDFIAIEQKEMQIADSIVVASLFVKKTLIENGVIEKKIYINPYGVDTLMFSPEDKSTKKSGLRFLFTGIVDARKGIPLLIKAWQRIEHKNCNLLLVGSIAKAVRQKIPTDINIEVKGKIPFKELPNVMRQSDIFVFPSYFEGFGLVILEAMASGLPVITTTATCGPDIIDHGKEGFIIEPGNQEQLEQALQFFITNPAEVAIMGAAARKKAEQYSWDSYGERWKKIIDDTLKY